jgi:hypothetical protein
MEKTMRSDGDFFDYAKRNGLSVKQEQEILDLIHYREDSAFDRGKACFNEFFTPGPRPHFNKVIVEGFDELIRLKSKEDGVSATGVTKNDDS